MNLKIRNRKGFTLMELIAVVVVLAILVGVALPTYFDVSPNGKASACKGALGSVRAGVANYFADEAISGSGAYPVLTDLLAYGNVMQEDLPDNPYDNDNTVNAATDAQADARTITGDGGWAYYTNGTTKAIFYANTDGSGENTW